MIPVRRVRKPAGFDAKVKQPGDAWLAANPDAPRPPAHWVGYVGVLATGFQERCGYGAMYLAAEGTVDHFLSVRNHRHLSYEWRNDRYVAPSINASKQNLDDSVLDPHEVGEGWFEILLPSLQLRVTDRVPPPLRAKAEFTLHRLKLRDGEKVIRQRRAWYAEYLAGRLTLAGLQQMAPLIADAVQRAGGAAMPAVPSRRRPSRPAPNQL